MGIIKEKYKKEYEKRVSELKNVILNAYSDYYNMVYIEPYLEKYKPQSDNEIEIKLLLPARNFMNSIVRTIQEEFILIICSLEDSDEKSNSLKRLYYMLKGNKDSKDNKNTYLVNPDLYSKQMKEMPEKDADNIKFARNKAIAHIQLKYKSKKVYMIKVKNRLDILKDCFNSYLFGDMVQHKIDDSIIDKIVKESQIGVQQLFYGFVNWICNR